MNVMNKKRSGRPSRRMFLRGIGGASLAIPVLPSLLDRSHAKAAENGGGKIFVAFASHGTQTTEWGLLLRRRLAQLPRQGRH